MSNLNRAFVLIVVGLSGCSTAASPGTEASARQHFASEFEKWMAGEESEVSTMKFRTEGLLAPISYEIRSVVSDKPDPLAFDGSRGLPDGWESWPAYRFNTAIEWKSQADTPIQKVTTYTLTWNSHEQKWYVSERFL